MLSKPPGRLSLGSFRRDRGETGLSLSGLGSRRAILGTPSLAPEYQSLLPAGPLATSASGTYPQSLSWQPLRLARPSEELQALFTPRCSSGVTVSRTMGVTEGTAQMKSTIRNALVDGQCLERRGTPHRLLGQPCTRTRPAVPRGAARAAAPPGRCSGP